jgi:hypothetical protein
MILKVMTESGWLYIGGIKSLDFNKDVSVKDYGVGGIADEDWYEIVGQVPSQSDAKPTQKKIVGMRENGKSFLVKFDSPAYMMSDDGKTIERF